MIVESLVRPSFYEDSVTLLGLARELRACAGVTEAAALMATPANKALLAQAGLLVDPAGEAGPNDLVVTVRAESPAAAAAARDHAEAFLSARRVRAESKPARAPRTIETACRQMPGAGLALISVPGPFAAAEARKALRQGLHVMLFSDNVALEDEVRLKRMAVARGRLMLGPDCGTAYLAGVPLGFANVVPRGRIGIVAASGTGLQQVATLLAARGEGLSHAIGVGSRDMSAPVGGLMTLAALDLLAADPATELIILIGKPPAPSVAQDVTARLQACGKPGVLALLGDREQGSSREAPVSVCTLEDAAESALAMLGGRAWTPRPFSGPPGEVRARVEAARRGRGAGRSCVRGLYAGGTLAHEAMLILAPLLGPVAGNLAGTETAGAGHRVTDLGADEFTLGRAHPMLDPTVRIGELRRAAEDDEVAVILLDVVLGHGAAADPAGDVVPALEAARARARARGRPLALVATVVGTDRDPQQHSAQTEKLEAAGVWVLPSNAQAARAAACIAGGAAVMDAVLGAPNP